MIAVQYSVGDAVDGPHGEGLVIETRTYRDEVGAMDEDEAAAFIRRVASTHGADWQSAWQNVLVSTQRGANWSQNSDLRMVREGSVQA